MQTLGRRSRRFTAALLGACLSGCGTPRPPEPGAAPPSPDSVRLERLRAAADALFPSDPDFSAWLLARHELAARAAQWIEERGANDPGLRLENPSWDIEQLLATTERALEQRRAWRRLPASAEPVRFDVREFGAIGDGVHDDGPAFRAAIARAVDAPFAELVLPAGVYRIEGLDPRGRDALYPGLSHVSLDAEHRPDEVSLMRATHLVIEGATNLVLRGEGPERTRILFAGPPGSDGLYVLNGQSVFLEGFSMDYEPLPYTQGTVTGVIDPLTYELTVDPGFAAADAPHLIGARNPLARYARKAGDAWIDHPDAPGTFALKSATLLEGRRYRIALYPEDVEQRGKDAFSLLGARALHYGRAVTSNPLTFDSCEHSGADRLHVYSSPAVGIRLIRNEFVEIARCAIIPKPGTDRMGSSNADGFFCQNNRVGPYLHHNRVSQNGDDYFNTNSGMSEIYRREGRRIVCRRGRSDHAAFRPGDRIYLLHRISHALIGEREVADVGLERVDGALRLALTLDQPLSPDAPDGRDPFPPGTFLCNRAAANLGAVILDNDFRIGFRSRCIVRSANTLVAGNRIVNRNPTSNVTWGHWMILGMHWHEGGPVRNVILRDNILDGIDRMFRAPHIVEEVEGLPFDALVRDVLIESNTFLNPVYRGPEDLFDDVYFRRDAVQNLVIRNNRYLPE
jgi:hypothetical protein